MASGAPKGVGASGGVRAIRGALRAGRECNYSGVSMV